MHNDRKREHLEICLTRNVRSQGATGLECLRLTHQALPEMALADVNTETEFLGHRLRAPILISAMTGGTDRAQSINRRLARAAQAFGLAMGLGSQRASLESPELLGTYQVRDVAPDILLFANLGAVQLNYGYGPDDCLRAVEDVQADALVLHLNPLQEALQPEGNSDFRGLADKIARVCRELPVPVIVKEVGWGLSAQAARTLCDAGVAALDVAGAGGTSWSEVERHRSASAVEAEVSVAFANWGWPTVETLDTVRRACPKHPLIASGGVRDGVEAAICLALGANLVGMAHPLLLPATESQEATTQALSIVLGQLRTAMFCTGARTLTDLDTSHLTVRS